MLRDEFKFLWFVVHLPSIVTPLLAQLGVATAVSSTGVYICFTILLVLRFGGTLCTLRYLTREVLESCEDTGGGVRVRNRVPRSSHHVEI
jgi:hypothetical protein